MLSFVLPVLAAFAAAPEPQNPQQPQTTTRLVPLQHLCPSQPDEQGLPWGSLMRYRGSRTADLALGTDSMSAITPDSIVDTLYGFAAEDIDEERLFLQTIDSNLLVIGEKALADRVGKYIAEAGAILARPMQVELCVWDASEHGHPGSVLDADAYAKFGKDRAPQWRAVGTCNAGQPLRLENMTWSRYVRGIEIEVAQKKTMTSPSTDRYGVGSMALARAHPLIGSSDFAVHLQFAVADRSGQVQSLQTGMPGAPDIELPHLDSSFATCSARIPNGGALAATLAGSAAAGDAITVTLRVTSTESPEAMSDPRAALIPIGALISYGLNYEAALPDVHENDDELFIEERSSYGYIPADNLQDLVAGVLAATDEEGEHEIKVGGGYLYVRASAPAIAAARSLLQGLQDEMIRNVEIVHAANIEPTESTAVATATRPLLHGLWLPTLLGREASAYRLHETNVVANIFVEVAPEAGSLAPSVQLLQSGSWFRCRLAPVGQSLHANIDLQTVVAPTPAMRSVMPGGGVLMQAEVAASRVDHDGVLNGAMTVDHGDGPRLQRQGQPWRTRMRTSFRR